MCFGYVSTRNNTFNGVSVASFGHATTANHQTSNVKIFPRKKGENISMVHVLTKALQKTYSFVFCSFAKYKTQPVSKFLNVSKISRYNWISIIDHNYDYRT